jgi:hypothetical protein
MTLLHIIIENFKRKPSVAWLRVIVQIVGDNKLRTLVNWERFLEDVKTKRANLFFTTVWARRPETRCIHDYLLETTNYEPFRISFGPQYKGHRHSLCGIGLWLDSPLYDEYMAIEWIKTMKIDPIKFIVNGLVSNYCKNTYLVSGGKQYQLKRAQRTLLLWVEMHPVYWLRGEDFKAKEMMYYWPDCDLGCTLMLGKPNRERQALIQEWNTWVDKNIR